METVIIVVVCYLMGSIPFGIFFSKILGAGDLRKVGSGNIGATNAFRTGKKLVGLFTMLFDVLKGFVPLYILRELGYPHLTLYICGVAAIVGHIFPIWLKGKGGKGVATSAGVVTGIITTLGLFGMGTCLATFLLVRVSSISSLTAFFATTAMAFIVYGSSMGIFMIVISLLVIYTHRQNIERLLRGEELSFKSK